MKDKRLEALYEKLRAIRFSIDILNGVADNIGSRINKIEEENREKKLKKIL